jgi:hypothetical protein
MIAFKFLAAGAVGLYSGFRWPVPGNGEPGEWVTMEGSLVACSRGLHACRAEGLLDWIDEELWEIELAGEVLENAEAGVVLAQRGRLLRQLEEWDEAAAGGLAEACVWRVRAHTTATLRRAGLDRAAKELAACRGFSELQALAAQHASASRGFPAQVFAYAADAVELARGGRPEAYGRVSSDVRIGPSAIAANLAFVSAVAAGAIAADAAHDSGAFASGFESERAWQRRWLLGRLGLGPPFSAGAAGARRRPSDQETMSSSSSR